MRWFLVSMPDAIADWSQVLRRDTRPLIGWSRSPDTEIIMPYGLYNLWAGQNESSAHLLKSSCVSANWRLTWWRGSSRPARPSHKFDVFKYINTAFMTCSLNWFTKYLTVMTCNNKWTYVNPTRGQSNLTKSASGSRGAHFPVRGHPRGSKFVPLNSWGRVSY